MPLRHFGYGQLNQSGVTYYQFKIAVAKIPVISAITDL
jgi:hypothetical protein